MLMARKVNGGFAVDLTRPPITENGAHSWDDAFADDLADDLGPEGVTASQFVRENSRTRIQRFVATGDVQEAWRLWLYSAEHDCFPFLSIFGITLWLAFVREEYVHYAAKPAALLAPIAEQVLQVHQRGAHLVTANAGQLALAEKNGNIIAIMERDHSNLLPHVPRIDANMATALLQQSVPLLASLDAQRVIRWEIFMGHKRRYLHDARRIDIPGGWESIAAELRLKDKNAAARVRAIVLTQAHMRFRLPGKIERYANLLSYVEQPATGQQPSRVQLVLGTILMPGHVHEYEKSDFEWPSEFHSARRLVPVLELPPLVGRPADWEPQASFSSWIVIEMRAQAKEIERHGSVRLDQDKLLALAEKASLTPTLLKAVIDRWCRDGNDGPAFLHQTEPDRYRLGDSYPNEWTYLAAAGRVEESASRAGKRAAVRKWKRANAKKVRVRDKKRAKHRKIAGGK
jgi:hypothetical protein